MIGLYNLKIKYKKCTI